MPPTVEKNRTCNGASDGTRLGSDRPQDQQSALQLGHRPRLHVLETRLVLGGRPYSTHVLLYRGRYVRLLDHLCAWPTRSNYPMAYLARGATAGDRRAAVGSGSEPPARVEAALPNSHQQIM